MDCIDSTFEAKLACLSCNIIKLQQTLKNTELWGRRKKKKTVLLSELHTSWKQEK